MIALSTLGSLDLRASTGACLATILGQPRRLALLVYLAVASPGRPTRRDALIALFWPNRDAGHARTALRQSLHFLRRELGRSVLLGGREEVMLDARMFSCDTVVFERAIDRGRPEVALAYYRGDLLSGFHVRHAPEFERWLELERARLRHRASAAAWQLARVEETAGNGVEAAYWARRAVSLAPDDEMAARRLIELLDRLGDRSGALRDYETLARRLADEFAILPAPETQRLIETIRCRQLPREVRQRA